MVVARTPTPSACVVTTTKKWAPEMSCCSTQSLTAFARELVRLMTLAPVSMGIVTTCDWSSVRDERTVLRGQTHPIVRRVLAYMPWQALGKQFSLSIIKVDDEQGSGRHRR